MCLLHFPFFLLQLVLALSGQFCQLWNHFVWLSITEEGSFSEMRTWSILLIKSDLKWYKHLSRSFFFIFSYLENVTARWPLSPRRQMYPSSTFAFVWFVAFWEHQHLITYKTEWNRNVGVYYTIPTSLSLFRHFRVDIVNFWNHYLWLRITGESSLPKMRTWSILLI